jgi:dihydroflavonol-4-reductase
MARVLLTGASGFLGLHLLRELRAAGAEVRGLSRSTASDALIAEGGGTPQRGDVTDPESLRQACEGVDAIFHAAADTSTWSRGNARQTRVNVEGTQALLGVARAAGVRQFLHTSSIAAYSHLVHAKLREDVPQRGADSWINYERSKHLGECAVRGSDLDWIVFQPSHILGPGDRHNWSKLFVLVDQEKLPGAPPGAGPFADVREVARAQVRAWQAKRWGHAYLLGGESASFLELISCVGSELNRRTPARATPAWILRSYARVLDLVSRATGREPHVTPEAAMFTCETIEVDCSKAQRDLDYRITPLPRLVADTLNWMRGEGMLR